MGSVVMALFSCLILTICVFSFLVSLARGLSVLMIFQKTIFGFLEILYWFPNLFSVLDIGLLQIHLISTNPLELWTPSEFKKAKCPFPLISNLKRNKISLGPLSAVIKNKIKNRAIWHILYTTLSFTHLSQYSTSPISVFLKQCRYLILLLLLA